MNKKGVLGKLITIVPIMFLIFIIMGVFVLLAAGGSITKSKGVFNTETISGSNLMERDIVVSGAKVSVSKAIGDFADDYVNYKYEFTKNPELAKVNKEDVKYNEAYTGLLNGLKDFINLDAQAIGEESNICLVLSAKIEEQFGKDEFKEDTKYPAKRDFAERAVVFYIERRSSGSLDGLSKDFDIYDGNINQEYVVFLNNYHRAVSTFSLVTEKGDELNGVYYYGRCLKG